MLRRPALATYSSLYSTFKTANDSLSTGRLAYIAERRDQLFSLNSSQYATFENYRSDLLEQIADIDTLDQQREAGTSINQSQYNTLVQQRAGTQDLLEQYMEALDSIRQLRIQSLLQLNAAVTTSLTPAANHKTVNAITLNWLATDELSSTDLATLVSIAEQCPLEGGDAVYEARSVVSHFEGTEYNDRDLCGTQNRQSQGKRTVANGSITIYPNPTSGQLFWTATSTESTIRVFNQLGELKIESRVGGNQTSIRALPDGMYTVQLLSDNGALMANTKIILVKN